GARRGPESEGRGREDGLDLRRYPGRLLGDRDAPREARGAEIGPQPKASWSTPPYRRAMSTAREWGTAIRPFRYSNARSNFSRARRAFAPIASVRIASSDSPWRVSVRGSRSSAA